MSRRADVVSGMAGDPNPAALDHDSGVSPASNTSLTVTLNKLLATAHTELDHHVNDQGACSRAELTGRANGLP